MSLDKKPKGNPNWVKGKSANPNGRPPGSVSIKSLLKVSHTLAAKKRHPVDELIRLADQAEQATTHVIITKSGATSWKLGEIVKRQDFIDLNGKVKDGNFAEAKHLPGGDKELAAKIWTELLKYCEPQKKPVESAPEKPMTPEESKANADAAMQMLKELEDGQSGANFNATTGNPPRLADGPSCVSPEAGSTSNLSGDQAQ